MSSSAYLGRDDAVPGFEQIAAGKVRDIYALDEDRLLFVTTDRVSAFDVVMNTGIPNKGRVLTAIAAHWFGLTADIVPHHLLSTRVEEVPGLSAEWQAKLRGRIMIVQRAEPDPVEWVVRGYIAGSGWKEYQVSQSVCGIDLPAGLELAGALPEAIVTPTSKHEAHDRPLSPQETRELVGDEHYEAASRIVLELFAFGTRHLADLGIVLADTKFELGRRGGEIVLIDEALTPDSSRFWDAASYRAGISPPSFDKQILRDYLETLDWNKEYPAPDLDPAVLERVSQRYLEICEKLTGRAPQGC